MDNPKVQAEKEANRPPRFVVFLAIKMVLWYSNTALKQKEVDLIMAGRGNAKTGGRKKGVTNKTTALLKDAVLQAAELAGDKDGMVGYLTTQAKDNPTAFLTLLGKVLPLQGVDMPDEEDKIRINIVLSDGDVRPWPIQGEQKPLRVIS